MNLEHLLKSPARRPAAPRAPRFASGLSLVALIALMGSVGCSNEEASWDASTSSVGAQIGDAESFDERWREYRVSAMAALDSMERAIESASREGSVADREQLMTLSDRIDELRARLLAEFDSPQDQKLGLRGELEASFTSLRGDVEALLLRLGHSAEEFSRWRPSS